MAFFDGTPASNASPAAFLLGATPVEALRIGTQSWCDKLSANTVGATTCTSLGVGSDTTLLELDVDIEAAKVLAEHPELRRVHLAANMARRRLLLSPGMRSIVPTASADQSDGS